MPGNEDLAKVTMKNKIYLHLNNTQYNGENISFTLIEPQKTTGGGIFGGQQTQPQAQTLFGAPQQP